MRLKETSEAGTYLSSYMQVGSFVCLCACVIVCGQSLGHVGFWKKLLWFRFSLEKYRIPRIQRLCVSLEEAQPDLWLMGWMRCGLLLPDRGMLSICQPDRTSTRDSERREGWKDWQRLERNTCMETGSWRYSCSFVSLWSRTHCNLSSLLEARWPCEVRSF